MQPGNTGLPKGKKRGTLSHLLLVFIFSFSFLGRGVSVPTLQMRESALPQAAPAVCLTRGAVSGRMDFLNLSSCVLHPHLLFCFPLATFANSSRYISPLNPPLTFSPPCSSPVYYPHHPLLLHLPLSPILLLSPALPDLHPGHPTPSPSPPRTQLLCTSPGLCVGCGVGTPSPWAFAGWWTAKGWSPALPASWGEASSLSPRAGTDFAGKRAAFSISRVSRACCGQIAGSGGF